MPFTTQNQRSLQGADWPKCDNCLWKGPSIPAWATRQTAVVLTETEGAAVGDAGGKTFSEEDKEFRFGHVASEEPVGHPSAAQYLDVQQIFEGLSLESRRES